MSLEYLDANLFDEVIYDNAESSVVIFSKQSCNICQNVSLILEDLRLKYEDKYSFYYVNAEEQKNLFQRFALKGVPQILFFKDGEYQGKLAGNVEEEEVEEKIEEVFE